LILNYFTKEKHGLIWTIQTEMHGTDSNKMESYFCSNPNRPSKIQWPTLLLIQLTRTEEAARWHHGRW
jgi:hypothetical protein